MTQVLLLGFMTVSLGLPCSPACSGSLLTEPLYTGLQRPLLDRVEPRLSGPDILSEKTQPPANSSCATLFEVASTWKKKQMFFKNIYETSVFKVHVSGTQTLLHLQLTS